MTAYYSEAIPLELLKDEQDRISKEAKACEKELNATGTRFDLMEQIIEKAINLASNCAVAYEKASPQVRRMFNQAFFEKVFVNEKKVSGFEYTEPFDLLINGNGSDKEIMVGVTGFEPVTSCL